MEATEIQAGKAARHVGSRVKVRGHAYAIRLMGNLAFLVLRDRSGTLQIVVESSALLDQIRSMSVETPILVEGRLLPQEKAPGQAEMHLERLHVFCQPIGPLPVEINKESKVDSLSLSTLLDYRPLTLRSDKVRSIFKIEAEICSAFREFLRGEGFTEIHSPKIVSTGTEGGAQLFKADYFGRPSYLAQSPQFYKQIMVGVFERVFEIGPVYRAEEHDTSRHLNEYISMDFEMGFIVDEQEVMAMETRLLQHVFDHLREYCQPELAQYGARVPEVKTIPQVTLAEAARILMDKCQWKPVSANSASAPASDSEPVDLDPEGERLLCRYFGEKEGSELVFITRYPHRVRPFYAMPEGSLSRSFDLLFRGLEITTGGQRIHELQDLVKSMESRGLDPADFQDYLQCFRYGMPPHGGLAIGLERLAKQLLNLPNVKLASLFPRDRNRLTP